MKTELVDVNETRKNLRVEIPQRRRRRAKSSASRATTRARRAFPGFRPGKAPARVIKQRFKDQILHDVAHDLIPRAVDDALRERGRRSGRHAGRPRRQRRGRPARSPSPRRSTRVPPFEPGDYSTLSLRRPSSRDRRRGGRRQALQRLRERAARFEPVEGRGVDRRRHRDARPRAHGSRTARPTSAQGRRASSSARRPIRRGSTSSCSASRSGATKTFTIHYPADYPIGELANTDVSYTVTVKGIKRRVLPGARRRVREGPRASSNARRAARAGARGPRARGAARRRARGPRRPDEAAGRAGALRGAGLARRARDRSPPRGVRAAADRPERRPAAGGHRLERVPREPARGRRAKRWRARIVLDEVARREQLEVDRGGDRAARSRRYAERTGRTPAAVRAALEKEGGLSRVYCGAAAGEVD